LGSSSTSTSPSIRSEISLKGVDENESLRSDVVAFWYKPHYQCNGKGGSTPQNAANFINEQLVGGENGVDFAGISEWVGADGISIGNAAHYGTIGSVCGYDKTTHTTAIVLFYKLDSWTLEESYPKSQNCNAVPIPPWTGQQTGEVCLGKTTPSDDNCCSCTYTEKEDAFAKDNGTKLGQRPWVAGIFSYKADPNNEKKICVVTGEMPHALSKTTAINLNGGLTSDPKPYLIENNKCMLVNTKDCLPNQEKSSIIFGTSTLVSGVTRFCGDNPIIFMTDSNAGMGYVSTSEMFLSEPMMSLTDHERLSSYTCCNSAAREEGQSNNYAADRIAVSKNKLTIDKLHGGSKEPAGDLPSDMTYQCHSAEEHTPLRAHISFKE